MGGLPRPKLEKRATSVQDNDEANGLWGWVEGDSDDAI